MKSGCQKYSDSISPKTIPKTNAEIRQLLDCLKADVEVYIHSLDVGEDAYINHFRGSILPVLKKKELLEPFEDQIRKYIRILEAKTVSIFHNFQISFKRLLDDVEQVSVLNKYESTTSMKDMHFFIESLKIVYVDFSNLLMIASQTFFVLESYCKILCALACVKFALKIARAELIQHNDCWKQLKRFSHRNIPYCETCVAYDTCTSKIDFEALSRIYCYSMKIRQIADYMPKLISFDIFKSGLMEPPFIYFKHLESILKENTLIYGCLSKDLPEIRARYEFGKSIAEELASPFLWGDEKRLQKEVKKKKDSDFYNYLLGRFYYQMNRFDEAIKPLEKAKKINPKNADVWRLLGTIYDDKAKVKKDLEKAIGYYRRARDLEPINYHILLELGILELGFGDYPCSIKNLTKASEYATTNFDKCAAFTVLSEAYRVKGMIGKSELYLKKSKQISESYADATLKWLRGFIEERAKLQ